jgi:YVTN family beta-propeller protein
VATLVPLLLVAGAAALIVALVRGSDNEVTVVPNSVAVVDAETNSVVDDVAIGSRPVAVAFGEGSVWVANADDGTVSRIDPTTRKVIGTIGVGSDVRHLATGFGSVWVADGKDGTLTRIEPHKRKVTTVRLGGGERAPVSWVAAGAGRVWATRGDALLQVDPASNKVVGRTRIPPPTGVAAGLGAAWLTTDDQRLLRVEPGPASAPVVKRAVTHRAIAPTVGAGSVWLIVYHGTGEIWRIDPDSNAVNIIRRTGRYPLDLAVAEETGFVWVVDSTGAVIRINPDIELAVSEIRTAPTISSSIAVGAGSAWVAVQE